MPKTYIRWIIVLAAVVGVGGFFGYQYWQKMKSALPPGIASGNGRIEAKLVDVVAKEPLRVKEIRVDEGDLVHPGQVLVVLDTVTLESELAEAKLSVAATQERGAVAEANITKREAEIELAKIEVTRARELVQQRAGSQRDLDLREMTLKTSSAGLREDQAKLRTIEQEVLVAQAKVATIQSRIDDAILKSPVNGRVLYRLTEIGEVVAAGGKALTLVNLDDVYMEIFLPSLQAASLKIGAQARLTVDFLPGRAVAAYVTFVSPEAQFTPKQVETRSERDKLMFRVKIRVPEKTVESHIELIKTGVRGVGYVKTEELAVWPDWLSHVIAPSAPAELNQSR